MQNSDTRRIMNKWSSRYLWPALRPLNLACRQRTLTTSIHHSGSIASGSAHVIRAEFMTQRDGMLISVNFERLVGCTRPTFEYKYIPYKYLVFSTFECFFEIFQNLQILVFPGSYQFEISTLSPLQIENFSKRSSRFSDFSEHLIFWARCDLQ